MSLLRWLYGSLIVGILYRYDMINKMLSSQWDNDNQHFVYIIVSWYLLGIITHQGFLFSCSCMNRCTCLSWNKPLASGSFNQQFQWTDRYNFTWHESWAVMPCKKTYSDVRVRNIITVKWIYGRIWFVIENALVPVWRIIGYYSQIFRYFTFVSFSHATTTRNVSTKNYVD